MEYVETMDGTARICGLYLRMGMVQRERFRFTS